MIANIKVAYDMLYYELHGVRYFDRNIYKPKIRQEYKTEKPPHIEMTPITDKKILDDMPF